MTNNVALVKQAIAKGIPYKEYRQLVSDLLLQEKSTGDEQSAELLNYSKLNNQRMKRLDKTIKIPENTQKSISAIDKPYIFLVITEGWCGDASQSVPIIDKVVQLNSNFEMAIVLRDDNPELIDAYLTNGGRAIPKVIMYDRASQTVISDWGPRPETALKMVADYKAQHGTLDDQFKEDLQIWYNENKGQQVMKELSELL